jgi:hypothetical protein
MTTSRIFVAGLAGGIAMFFWASIAHMALPLGRVGISQISGDEPAVLNALRTTLGDTSGFYAFPGYDLNSHQADAMKEYDAKLVSSPSGILIYHPPGAKALTPGQLVTEFLVELLEAILAIWLLSKTEITSLAGRIGFVATAGLLASLPTNISYWNWYGFPGSYTTAYMATQIIGFAIAGTAAAFVLRFRTPINAAT